MSDAAHEKDARTIEDGVKSSMETIDEKPKTDLANRENIFFNVNVHLEVGDFEV